MTYMLYAFCEINLIITYIENRNIQSRNVVKKSYIENRNIQSRNVVKKY